MTELNYTELINTAKIKKDMTVDIIVDIFNVTKQCMKLGLIFSPNKFIDALKEKIGENGNILIRAFNWDWCHNVDFDIKKTLSQSGSLGNIAINRPDFKRTKHPIYNWLVWGKEQNYLCNLDNKEAFEENKSVFWWEESNNLAYQINIGHPTTNGISLFHYIEKKVKVPYRYVRDYTNNYTDLSGKKERKTYSMFVRDLKLNIETDDSAYDKELETKNIKKNYDYKGIEINSYKIKELCELYENDFTKNKIPTGVKITPIN